MSVMKLLKKSFYIDYDDGAVYPTWACAMEAIAKHCAARGWDYAFGQEDEVRIEGVLYDVFRGIEPGSRGNYAIKCREK